MKKGFLVLLLIVVLVVPFIASAAELKFGLLPRLSEKEMVEGFTPLAKYLEKELGVIDGFVPTSDKEFSVMIEAGKAAGAY